MNMDIIKSASSVLSKANFKVQKHSPEILVVAGIIGGIAGAVMACRATTKANAILEESKENIDKINFVSTSDEYADVYSEDDRKRDLVATYVNTGLNLAKVYAPSVIVGGISIASILWGHKILRGRNLALAAAYATIDKSFKDYRGRVIDRFGKEVDYQIKHNIKAREVTKKIENPETGKIEKVTETEYEVPDISENGYSRLYANGCRNWTNVPSLNKSFLMAAEDYLTRKLETQGYLFLSEVYNYLGYRETQASRVVGWIYDKDNPIGDNRVYLGFRDDDNFMDCKSANVWLDFNVDGPILDRFEDADATWSVC